ncbi:MAG: dihydrodipicolinate synthase family protein [Chloroflexota bacterium]|nr:dihydrodipicolinate synthase family protein [Chloroflexota bacterium]
MSQLSQPEAAPGRARSGALWGVYAILATPFLPDGALDEASLRQLTLATSIDGVTVLGVAGEVHKLTDAERSRVLAAVVETVDGRVPVVAGVSRDGTDAAIVAARDAEEAGAVALMIAPPAFAQAGASLTEHFRRIGDATRLPIVLQDFPPANGVTLSRRPWPISLPPCPPSSRSSWRIRRRPCGSLKRLP